MGVTTKKDKKLINRQIKIVLLLSIISTFVSIIMLINIKNININNINITDYKISSSFIDMNYILAFISVGACWVYYYIYKKGEFLVITLVYISFATEYLFETIFMTYIKESYGVLGLLIFTSIARMILITLIIKGNNKFTKLLNEKKELAVLLTVISTIGLMLIEGYFKYIKVIISNKDIIVIFNILIILYYIYSIIKLAIKIINESDFIWAVIIASINMFILKKLYLIIDIYTVNIDLHEWCKLFTLSGFVILIIGLFIEIINKVKENEILQEELEVFYNLTEKNPINNVYIYDENSNIVYANALLIKHEDDRVNCEDDPYKNVEKLYGNKLYSKFVDEINEKLNGESHFNKIVFLKNNKIIRLDVRRIEFKKGKIRTVVSFRYITEEFKRNREMKINENKFLAMTESIKDIICMLDIEGTITYVNTMVEDVIGYSKEELIGKNYTFVLDKKDERAYNFINSNYQDSAFMEHSIICKDNSIIIMESVISKIFTENNELVGHALVSRDISYRNEFESLKLKYNEMKAYDKIRTEFFANLSHEVRTPINIIYSCFQLLNNQKEKGPESLAIYYDKYEKTIKQNCFRMLRLVNNLIDITKIDSGFVKMRFGNYNIINLVEDITLSVIPYVEAKKINIMFDTELEELEIKCDPDEIERVMLNLISNAIKFNEVGGSILVNISISETWVEISVKDTGIGIAKEMKNYIFERFAQNDKSLNRENEGSGIGLALVKSLVELHDGEVYLLDNEEKGSEFIVKLPNVTYNNVDEEVKNISGNNSKPTAEKISIELSDIYDLI